MVVLFGGYVMLEDYIRVFERYFGYFVDWCIFVVIRKRLEICFCFCGFKVICYFVIKVYCEGSG